MVEERHALTGLRLGLSWSATEEMGWTQVGEIQRCN